MTLDLAKLRAETLALLDGTTPGPWRMDATDPARINGGDGRSVGAAHRCGRFIGPDPAQAANARLIAAAPRLATDTLRLLDEIERLTAENARLRAKNNKLRDDMSGGSFYKEDDIDAMQNEIERLRAERDDMQEVVSRIVEHAHRQTGIYPPWFDDARRVLGDFEPSPLHPLIDQREAYKAGAEAMREAAAAAAVNVHNVRIIGCRMGSDWINGHRIGSYDAYDAIRVLPLPDQPKEGS